MTGISIFSLLAVGFGLGLKHALEADHLAAVSNIVGDRKSVWSASIVGALWGLGHTISLFVAAIAVLLFHFEIGERLGRGLELGVAVMLIVLGCDTLRKLFRGGQVHLHFHRHGGRVHAHPHVHAAEQAHQRPDHEQVAKQPTHHGLAMGARPLIVGMIHGLAGSGALMLLVLSTISSPLLGMSYILIFGVGSIGGMMAMSLLLSLPFRFTAQSFGGAAVTMRGLAAAFSISLGLFMVYQTGIAAYFGVR
jgi:ABC-type nickel/cobalt efflux system permease component RcnA